MQFNFHLADIDEITPWGKDQLTLQWFGLTLGWFWIDISGQQLFRYSQDILDHWEQQTPSGTTRIPDSE